MGLPQWSGPAARHVRVAAGAELKDTETLETCNASTTSRSSLVSIYLSDIIGQKFLQPAAHDSFICHAFIDSGFHHDHIFGEAVPDGFQIAELAPHRLLGLDGLACLDVYSVAVPLRDEVYLLPLGIPDVHLISPSQKFGEDHVLHMPRSILRAISDQSMLYPQIRDVVLVLRREDFPPLDVEDIGAYQYIGRFQEPEVFVHRVRGCPDPGRSQRLVDVVRRHVFPYHRHRTSEKVSQQQFVLDTISELDIIRYRHIDYVAHGLHRRLNIGRITPEDRKSPDADEPVEHFTVPAVHVPEFYAFRIRQRQHSDLIESAAEVCGIL